MIGQIQNINKFKILCDKDNIPALTIISGPLFSGKTSLMKEFCKLANRNYVFIDSKVDAMRDMIEESYTTEDDKIYCIENFENLSKAAQNSVLKIFEDAPKHVKFIITTNNENYMLDTILSRGQLFRIEPYTQEELKSNRFDTPSKVDYWKTRDVEEFDNLLKELYSIITTKKTVEVYNYLRDKVCFDIAETGYYYTFVIEELDKIIKHNLKNDYNQFLRYNNLINEFYDKSNVTKFSQENLFDKTLMKINRMFVEQ